MTASDNERIVAAIVAAQAAQRACADALFAACINPPEPPMRLADISLQVEKACDTAFSGLFNTLQEVYNRNRKDT